MEQRFGVATALEKGSNGVFEVTYGNELIFSKKALGRFPEPGEVEQEIEKRVA